MHTDIIVHKDGRSDLVRLDSNCMQYTENRDITELDRLSYTVHQIEGRCQVVPIGSLKKTPLGEITRNDAWEGVMMAKVDSLESYMYLRPV